ncbi:MAG: PAS domain S-box protein [Nitrospiria bacterium]
MPPHDHLNETNALLQAIGRAQEHFIRQTEPRQLFDDLLSDLLALTKSAYGFIGEVRHQADGQPYLKTHAITNIAWNDETLAFYEENAPEGLEFYHLNTLFGSVMTTGESVIANDPRNDSRRGGLPEGHPALDAFLGLPVCCGKTLIGMIGIANRPGGYDESLVAFLQPLLKTYGQIIEAFNAARHRKQTENALRDSLYQSRLLETYISLTSGLSLKAVTQTTLEFLRDHLDIVCSSVAVIDPDQAGFRVYALHREDSAWNRMGEYVPWETTVWSEIVKQKTSKYRPDIAAAASGFEFDRELIRLGLLSDMIVPLWLENQCLGTLNVTSERIDGLTEQTRHLIPLLAPSLAQAIHNAVLYDVLLEEKNKLKAVVRERKQVEEAFRDSEARFHTIFEQANDAIFLIDPGEDKILEVNLRACRMLGFTKEELLSLHCSDIHPDELSEFQVFIESVFEKGKGFTGNLTCRTKEGLKIPAEISAATVDLFGKTCLIAVIRNMTEKKEAEALQRLSTTVFETAAEAILVTDAEQKIISINPAFARITGYSEAEVLGQTPRMFKSGRHDAAFYEGMWNTIHTHGYWEGEIWDKKKDGTIFLNRLSINAVRDQEENVIHYTSLYTDITERKRLEEQLHQAQKLETIGQLAGGVAHEFNNLLTPIIGQLEIVSEQTRQQPAVQASLRAAEKAARRAAILTKELLSFSRKTPMTLRPQSLTELAGEVLHLLRQTIDRQIEITLESAEGLWPSLIDTDQIHQVIMNLCVNARDALQESLDKGERVKGEGFRPLIRIEMKNAHVDEADCKAHPEAKPGDFVCLSVTDNGEGIDAAALPHLFEPFFTTKEVGRGTGLGLASSYGIVKRHGGWIGVKTVKGEGTTFAIHLPCTKGPVVTKGHAVRDCAGIEGAETIMIVDDDELIRDLGKAVLERRGYTVLLAEGGAQALEIFERERGCIDMVVLDLSMPRESGWEVFRRLRALDPGLKVIVSSGHDIAGQTQDKGNLEPYTILSKPFSPREMERKVRAVLHQDKSH